MLNNIRVPPSFSLIKKERLFLLLRKEYKDLLIRQGIADIETFVAKYSDGKQIPGGRSLHPSILLGDGRRIVLRRYLHGGLLRGVTKDLYAFGSRSFQELVLTEEIRAAGIPTILPIGAIHKPVLFPFYRAYLLTLEVPNARNLVQFFQETGCHPMGELLTLKRDIIRSAGSLVRKFHDSGFYHGDLQLGNFLVAGTQVLLIDFDRSSRVQNLSGKKRMKNLVRLNRSVDKWKRQGLGVTSRDRLRFFWAYAGVTPHTRETLRKALRAYSVYTLLHRWRWRLGALLKFLTTTSF